NQQPRRVGAYVDAAEPQPARQTSRGSRPPRAQPDGAARGEPNSALARAAAAAAPPGAAPPRRRMRTGTIPPPPPPTATRAPASAVISPPSRIPTPGAAWVIDWFKLMTNAIQRCGVYSCSAVCAAIDSTPLPMPPSAAPITATTIVGAAAIRTKPAASAAP